MPDRSAKTGEYVSAAEAAANPDTTVHEDDRSIDAVAILAALLELKRRRGGQPLGLS